MALFPALSTLTSRDWMTPFLAFLRADDIAVDMERVRFCCRPACRRCC